MGRWPAAPAAVLILALLLAAPPLRALDLGAGPVLLFADEVQYDTKTHVVTATGNVEVTRGERRLLADVLRYYQDTDRMEAEGNVALVEPGGDTLFADRVVLSGDLRAGVAHQLRARLADNSLIAAGGRPPHRRRAHRASNARSTRPARSARIPTRRRSGSSTRAASPTISKPTTSPIAMPSSSCMACRCSIRRTSPTPIRRSNAAPAFWRRASATTASWGMSVQPVYFFALAPNYDATLAPIFYTQENPVLAGEYRHLVENGRFQFNGSGTYASKPIENQGEPQPPGKTFRGAIEGNGRFRLPHDWAQRLRSGTGVRRDLSSALRFQRRKCPFQ